MAKKFKKDYITRKSKSQRPSTVKTGGKYKQLTAKHIQFIEAYFATNHSIKKASQAVGISANTGKDWTRRQVIVDEMDRRREELKKKVGYTLEVAMNEAEEAKNFAEATNNANAYVKAVELKTKLNGLLIEKHDHRLAANFQINVEGIRRDPLPAPNQGAVPVAANLPPLPIGNVTSNEVIEAQTETAEEKRKSEEEELGL